MAYSSKTDERANADNLPFLMHIKAHTW